MRIGGFQKNTLIDFPGEMACLVFTPGCNLACPYCHNPELVETNTPELETETVFEFLKQRKGFLDGVVITGGEPCLQSDLLDFVQIIKGMGFKVKLDSNGSRPRVLETLLDQGLLDYVAMDIKTDAPHYPELAKGNLDVEKIKESISLIMDRAPDYEFRTTCLAPFTTPETMANMGKRISGAKRYILQNCSKEVDMLDPVFMETRAQFLGPQAMEELKRIAEHYVETVSIR